MKIVHVVSCLTLPFLLLACDPRTTEQPGLDPRLEAEVANMAEALAAGPLKVAGNQLLIGLVDEGELAWVRTFGQQVEGEPWVPEQAFPAPDLLPTVLAVGLERLVDQERLSLTDARRLELLGPGGSTAAEVMAAELEKAAGRPWQDYLREEITDPLKMTATRFPAGAPNLETSAADLIHLMVDLQKAHAGRTFKRLRQEAAQRLLRPLNGQQGFTLEFGGQGQSAYFLRRGSSDGLAYLWLGFYSSGNGVVIFGPSAALVDEARAVVAKSYDWPALKG